MDKKIPSLSIIIPVYNVEKYLRQCVDSVLSQIDKRDEIILINDGSTDSCYDICQSYKEKSENICFIDRQNAGLGKTRNVGLQRASNEYVIFLDSDDYWAANAASIIKGAIRSEDADILYFDAEKIFEDGFCESKNQYDRRQKVSTVTMTGRQFFEQFYPYGYIVQACMAVYKRDFLAKHEIFFQEGVYYEDNIFSFKAIMCAEKVRYLPYLLYQRRVHHNSITTCATDYKRVADQAEVTITVWNYIRHIWNDLKGAVLFRIMNYTDDLLYAFRMRYQNMSGEKSGLFETEVFVFSEYLSFIQRYEKERRETKILKLYLYIRKKKAEEQRLLTAELFGDAEKFEKTICSYQRNYRERTRERLMKLPLFDPDCKAGIYGLGDQAKKLTEFCKKNGMAAESVTYIDSYKQSDTERYQGCTVKNIRDIGCSVNTVVISSFLYREEMYRTAQKFLPADTAILPLYKEGEDEILWELL